MLAASVVNGSRRAHWKWRPTHTVATLASTSTFDKAHETVFARSATASVKVYGPMLMP